MTHGGYADTKRGRSASLALVILLHGAGLTALALAKMDVITKKFGDTDVIFIDTPPTPPPEPVDDARPKDDRPQVVTRSIPIVDPPVVDEGKIPLPPTGGTSPFEGVGSGTGIGTPAVDPPPPPPPMRTDAQIDSRSVLQPPYPPSEERAGAEGTVVIRVLIGPDGRVKGAEKVRATSDAFYEATLRHALRKWRFKPATLDGRPVESRKVMSLRFEIDS